MKIQLNGADVELDDDTVTIADVLKAKEVPVKSIVVVVNDDVVSRDAWADTTLAEDDRVDIVHAVSGGEHDDPLVIAGKTFGSRLFVGTGKYADNDTMNRALDASGTEMVTVAIRLMNLDKKSDAPAQDEAPILESLDLDRYALLPNTAGAYTTEAAVKMARLARAVTGTNWIKLEVIGDQRSLWPDVAATIEATDLAKTYGEVAAVAPGPSPDSSPPNETMQP